MNNMKKDYNEKWIVNAKAVGKAEGKAEERLNIAKAISEERLNIAKAFGMSLSQLEEIVQKNSPIEN